jgi:hypothetical protein
VVSKKEEAQNTEVIVKCKVISDVNVSQDQDDIDI